MSSCSNINEEDKPTMTVEDLEGERQRFYELGRSEGLQIAQKRLMDKATSAFEKGQDTVAYELRTYAQEMREESERFNPNNKAES